METCIGYITAKNKDEALAIGRALVEKKLVACANVLPQMESIYRWEGKVESAHEAVLVVKTIAKMRDKVATFVKALHSYEVPCIVFYDIHGGNKDYLKWIHASVLTSGAK